MATAPNLDLGNGGQAVAFAHCGGTIQGDIALAIPPHTWTTTFKFASCGLQVYLTPIRIDVGEDEVLPNAFLVRVNPLLYCICVTAQVVSAVKSIKESGRPRWWADESGEVV